MASPVPVTADLRFSARVDYFVSRLDALDFATARRAEGFNVNGGGSLDPRQGTGSYAGLWGVHWVDRKGEGFYG